MTWDNNSALLDELESTAQAEQFSLFVDLDKQKLVQAEAWETSSTSAGRREDQVAQDGCEDAPPSHGNSSSCCQPEPSCIWGFVEATSQSRVRCHKNKRGEGNAEVSDGQVVPAVKATMAKVQEHGDSLRQIVAEAAAACRDVGREADEVREREVPWKRAQSLQGRCCTTRDLKSSLHGYNWIESMEKHWFLSGIDQPVQLQHVWPHGKTNYWNCIQFGMIWFATYT